MALKSSEISAEVLEEFERKSKFGEELSSAAEP